jgi:4'-phosphopantetheinyl transferase
MVIRMKIHSQTAGIRDRKLARDEVHIWRAFLDVPATKFERLLDSDERMRAARYKFERDSNRFIVRRGILRILTGCYSGIEPESVLFSLGDKGKPALANRTNSGRLYFNLSHSEGMAIYAFSGGHEVGVDIEKIRDVNDLIRLAERFFSSREKAELSELPADQQRDGFFNAWTRKEAVLKALGDGLSYSLDRLDVTLAPATPAKLLTIGGDPGEALAWSIHDLRPALNFAGALAAKGQINNIESHRWVA